MSDKQQIRDKSSVDKGSIHKSAIDKSVIDKSVIDKSVIDKNAMLDKRPPDPGLQPQRTILSWFRTIAVIFLNALFLIKAGLHAESKWLLILSFILLFIAVLMYAYCLKRNQIIDYDIEVVSQNTVKVHKIICASLALVALSLTCYFAYQLFL